MTTKTAVKDMNFEQALAELEGIVRNLEQGEIPLEQSIQAYERGVQLKQHCEQKLREAQAKIEKISVAPDGTPTTQPLDEQEG